jgi:hypothetical protein
MSHRYHRPLRHHEIERLLRERDVREAAARKKFWHNVLVVKATVMVTFVLYLVVPPDYKDWVALTGNLLWLWRT